MLRRALLVGAGLALFAGVASAQTTTTTTPVGAGRGPARGGPALHQRLTEQQRRQISELRQQMIQECERYRELQRSNAAAEKLTQQRGKMRELHKELRALLRQAGAGRGLQGFHARRFGSRAGWRFGPRAGWGPGHWRFGPHAWCRPGGPDYPHPKMRAGFGPGSGRGMMGPRWQGRAGCGCPCFGRGCPLMDAGQQPR